MANFLVTGGAGFIGSHIVKRLVAEGENVRVLDNFATGKRENLQGVEAKIDLVEGDIRDREILARALADIDYVLHQAALPSVPRSMKNPWESHDVNVNGTVLLLETCRQTKPRKVVYAASSSAYGDQPEAVKVETMKPMPLSPYAISKLMGEYYCSVYARCFDVPTISLRYFNIFGPHQDPASQYAAVVPKFVRAVLEDQPPTIYGDGYQSRDFTFVENAVEANLLAAKAEKGIGEMCNIACGGSFNLHELLETIYELTGKRVEPHYDPPRPGDVRHSKANIEKARELLGYKVVVEFKEGVGRTVDWHR